MKRFYISGVFLINFSMSSPSSVEDFLAMVLHVECHTENW